VKSATAELESDATADGGTATRPPAAPAYQRMPLPGPDDDVRPRVNMPASSAKYMQGEKLPVTSSVLISNSKYLNDPYYREAYVTQALRRHGPDLPPTYMVPMMHKAIAEVSDPARFIQLVEEEKAKYPEFAQWLEARRYTSYVRDDLARHAKGTLGHAIHEFLGIPGMDMEFATRNKSADTDLEYLLKRRGSLHDIEHMISGFGPNTAGENALAMFNVTVNARFFTPELAQYLDAAIVWITSSGYNRTALHYYHVLPTYLDAMRQGITAGLEARKPLFLVQWEDYLDWQLDDIAKDLGYTRGPAAAWDWTTEAATG
jgi:ubiquinone biosynthesis protein COQ4